MGFFDFFRKKGTAESAGQKNDAVKSRPKSPREMGYAELVDVVDEIEDQQDLFEIVTRAQIIGTPEERSSKKL